MAACWAAQASLILLSCFAPFPALVHAMAKPSASTWRRMGGSSAPARAEPNVVGSGLRLLFNGAPNQAYCLVSDPCLHVNAIMAGAGEQTWVSSYGMRAGHHSLTITARGPFFADEVPDVSFTFDGDGRKHIMAQGTSLETPDALLRVESWGKAKGAFLVTAGSCGVRLLVFAKKGLTTADPRLSLDVLDWDRLDGPHGIIGQIFPNRADPKYFGVTGYLRRSWEVASTGTDGSENKGRKLKEVAGKAVPNTSITDAIRRLYKLKGATQVLDGLPEDYAASGPLEPDCIFSRFPHE